MLFANWLNVQCEGLSACELLIAQYIAYTWASREIPGPGTIIVVESPLNLLLLQFRANPGLPKARAPVLLPCSPPSLDAPERSQIAYAG